MEVQNRNLQEHVQYPLCSSCSKLFSGLLEYILTSRSLQVSTFRLTDSSLASSFFVHDKNIHLIIIQGEP